MDALLLRLFVKPSARSDPHFARQALRVVYFGLAMVLWVPVFTAIYLLLGSPRSAAIILAAGLLCIAGLFSLRWRPSILFTGNLVAALLLATLAGISWFSGGIEAPALIWLCAVPLIGTLLCGVASGVCWATASCAVVVAYLAIGESGIALPRDITAGQMRLLLFSGLAGIILCSTLLSAIFQRSVWHAHRLLESARRAAEETNAAKSRFLANVSHEIRTPMNAVIGMSELALQTRMTDEQQEYIQTVHASANALLEIIDDILDISRVEAGRMELHPHPFSIRPLVDDVVRMLRLSAGEKCVSLSCRVADDVPDALVGDASRLRQVLVNLVGNAVKFTETGSVVVAVGLEAEDDGGVRLLFQVSDTGIGIPPEERETIFEPFAQADASTTRLHGGAGLGLAISSRLVSLMGGCILVESTLGEGSTFCFTLPFHRAGSGTEPDEQPLRPWCIEPADRPKAGPLKVLLAEDNPVNRTLATRMLERIGHEVAHAATGSEAVAAWKNERFDLLLLDVQMPEMDGLAATAEIRRLEAGTNRRTPIVAVTAHAMQGDRERCLKAGMDAYLAKPIRLEELSATIRRVAPNGTNLRDGVS